MKTGDRVAGGMMSSQDRPMFRCRPGARASGTPRCWRARDRYAPAVVRRTLRDAGLAAAPCWRAARWGRRSPLSRDSPRTSRSTATSANGPRRPL
jgi:hypothetical protein